MQDTNNLWAKVQRERLVIEGKKSIASYTSEKKEAQWKILVIYRKMYKNGRQYKERKKRENRIAGICL